MSRPKRTAPILDQPPKVEAPASQGKAGTKGKGKQKQADDKAAKANVQVEGGDDSAKIAEFADIVMNDNEISQNIVDIAPQVIPEQVAGPEQAPDDA